MAVCLGCRETRHPLDTPSECRGCHQGCHASASRYIPKASAASVIRDVFCSRRWRTKRHQGHTSEHQRSTTKRDTSAHQWTRREPTHDGLAPALEPLHFRHSSGYAIMRSDFSVATTFPVPALFAGQPDDTGRRQAKANPGTQQRGGGPRGTVSAALWRVITVPSDR